MPTVVFPLPDSPTMPIASPGRQRKPTSRTTSNEVPSRSTRRASTARPAASWCPPGLSRVSKTAVLASAGSASPPVDDQVDAHRQERDGEYRGDHAVRLDGESGEVLADDQAPVGRGRLDAEAEEAQARDQQDGAAQPDSEVDGDRREDVRQQLLPGDVPDPLAARPRVFDVRELDHPQRRRVDDPGYPGGIGKPDTDDQQQGVRAVDGHQQQHEEEPG